MSDFEAPEPWRIMMSLDKNQALITQRLESMAKTLEDLGSRVTELEKRKWPANTVSVIMAIIAIIGFASTYLFR